MLPPEDDLRIKFVDIEAELKTAYLDYAMSVITSRAARHAYEYPDR